MHKYSKNVSKIQDTSIPYSQLSLFAGDHFSVSPGIQPKTSLIPTPGPLPLEPDFKGQYHSVTCFYVLSNIILIKAINKKKTTIKQELREKN